MSPVDVTDLLDRPGESRPVSVDEPIEGLKVALAEVPGDVPVHADLLLESVTEGILVSGSLSVAVQLTCARCLSPLEGSVEARVQELFSPNPGEEDYPLDEAGVVDLEPLVRDAVVLALPFAPLCMPDCLGLCARCGGNRNRSECTCSEPLVDPRWAVLDALELDSFATEDGPARQDEGSQEE